MILVLSPHLDDAVLSAWSYLDGRRDEVAVVTVFTGVPPEGTLSLWDRLCGATSSAEMARARRAEDTAVMTGLGLPFEHLDFPDALNRHETPSLAALVEAVGTRASGAQVVLAPMAGGPRAHPDHVLTRDAARELGLPAILYGDTPYCAKGDGWPSVFGGAGGEPRWLGRVLRDVPEIGGGWWDASVVELSESERAEKRAAMEAYGTQFRHLDTKLRQRGLVSDPGVYGREVYVPLAARPQDALSRRPGSARLVARVDPPDGASRAEGSPRAVSTSDRSGILLA